MESARGITAKASASRSGKERRPNKAVITAQARQDDSIMNTNDSSIVSKRSVTKFYFPHEPDFYAPFVKKFQRRNPLINRGYWLRMQAVEQVVRRFLEQPCEKQKVVVNLGCGYDPLPFRFLHTFPDLCHQANFVDVDYPQLMRKKQESILADGFLEEVLGSIDCHSGSQVLLKTAKYAAVGCDLRDLDGLKRTLEELGFADHMLLFVAEVSITYMEVNLADTLIQWAASSFANARFCLLEQYLPDGRGHPFAATMLKHFEKLQTQIHAVAKYPSLEDQRSRFLQAGWASVNIQSLWHCWTADDVVSAEQRKHLDTVEPFDEWEEFALFAGHYFLLVASTAGTKPVLIQDYKTLLGWSDYGGAVEAATTTSTTTTATTTTNSGAEGEVLGSSFKLRMHPIGSNENRRFGAAFQVSERAVAYQGGYGMQARLRTTQVYKADDDTISHNIPPTEGAYMCHTITNLGNGRHLLTGGRTSPSHANPDCFLFKDGEWKKIEGIQPARYRNSAVPITLTRSGKIVTGVLVFGGKTETGQVLDEWQLWDEENGWQAVRVTSEGAPPTARFGATMALSDGSNDQGILTGGLSDSGQIRADIWTWSIKYDSGAAVQLECKEYTPKMDSQSRSKTWARFGANLVQSSWGMLLIGGIGETGILSANEEILAIRIGETTVEIQELKVAAAESSMPRALLLGSNALTIDENEVFICGGGAVCFSMGSYVNQGSFSITRSEASISRSWHVTTPPAALLVEPAKNKNGQSHADSFELVTDENNQRSSQEDRQKDPEMIQVERVRISSEEEFQTLVATCQPAIIQGLDLGPCIECWTPEYLVDRIGADREVIVHSSSADRMTFQTKNFTYVKQAFGSFMHDVTHGGRLYLRAIASKQPAKHATSLWDDFPSIADDFRLPPELASTVQPQMHSSPLRISGPVTLWLHYDVLANVLCQIRGSKTLRLFPPSDVAHLGFPPGGSSSNIDPADPVLLEHTHPREVRLQPGDVLFLPPMWAHSAAPTDELSIAVNVFWRNLPSERYAIGRDVYGNRDLAAYEQGRKGIEGIKKAFTGLPADVRDFYLQRLVDELKDCCIDTEEEG